MATDVLTRIIRIVGEADLSQMKGQLERVQQAFSSSMTRLQKAAAGVGASLRPLTGAIGSLVGATGAMGSAVGNLIMSGFNPLALAIGGATLAVGLLTRAWNDSRRRAEEFTKSMEDQDKRIWDLNNAYLEMTGQIDAAEAATRKLHRSQEALAIQAKREKIARMESIQGAIPESPLGFVGRALGLEGAGRRAILGDIEKEKRELAEMEAKLQTEIAGTQRNIRQQQRTQIIPKQERDDVEQFLARLKSQLGDLERRKVEISIGPEAALDKRLEQEIDKLKEKLGGKISPEQLAQIEVFSEKIRAADREVRQLNDALKALEHLDFEDMERGGKAMQDLERQAGKTAESLRRQVEDLEKVMGVEVLSRDDQSRARIQAELDERLRLIQDWVNAQRAAGRDVELINAQAAAATEAAWASANTKMLELTGDMNKVWAEYKNKMSQITTEAAVLGGALDTTRMQTDLIIESIRKLLAIEASGVLTADELERVRGKIAELKGEWETLNQDQSLKELIDGVGSALKTGIGDTLRGLRQGTQDFETAFRSMASNMLMSIAELIFQLGVLKPLLDSLKPGGGGAGGGGTGQFIMGLLKGAAGFVGGFFHEGGEVERPQLAHAFRRPSITPAFGGFEMPGTKLASPFGGLKPDEVPAILQLGELVLTKEHQRELNDTLAPSGQSLRSVFPEFHEGGEVEHPQPAPALAGMDLRPDEVAAILQVGEAVLTKRQQQAVNQRLSITGTSLRDMLNFHNGGLVATYGGGKPEELSMPEFHSGGVVGMPHTPRLALSVPTFHGGGLVLNHMRLPRLHDGAVVGGGTFPPGTGSADFASPDERPIQITMINDYTGSVAPSELKTGKKEIREHIIKDLRDDGPIRRAMRRDKDRGG